jgi:hypothetical protein
MATTSSTGSVPALTKPARPAGAERPIVLEFIVGYAALWVVFTAMTESKTTSGLAAALAVAAATGSTFLYLAKALENLNLAKGGTP